MSHTIDSPTADPDLDQILALESVPPVTTTRWIPRRKAQVVRAVEAGVLSGEEACRLYCLTIEELESWQRALNESGERGLRITRRAIELNRRTHAWGSWESSGHHLVNG